MIRWLILTALVLIAGSANADSLMVNLAPDRPAFNLKTEQGTLSRTLAPGSRLVLESGQLSVAGSTPLVLEDRRVYFWARWKGPDRLYQLTDDQALVVNATGLALSVRLEGAEVASGLLANASFALGAKADNGLIRLEWEDQAGGSWTATLEGGRLYRLELGSPEGIGIQPVVVAWDELVR